MPVYLAPTFGAGYQAFDTSGLPLNGGFISTFAAGTATPASTWTTSTGLVANPVSIQLGTDGRPPNEIWLTSATTYLFQLFTSSGVSIKSYDNLYGIGDPFAAGSSTGPFLLTGVAGTNTITATGPSGITYFAGLTVLLPPANTNTSTATLNITPSGSSALGAKNIFLNGAGLVGNELVASTQAMLEYDGTQFNILGNSAGSLLYTTGTWTPSIGGTATYTTQVGTYTKIGRMVFVQGVLTINALGTGNTSVLTGLPFAAAASPANQVGVAFWSGIAVTPVYLCVVATAGGTSLTAEGITAASATLAPLGVFGNGASLIFSIAYTT